MLRSRPVLFLFYALVLFLAITIARSLKSDTRAEAPDQRSTVSQTAP